jgi:hypothetical protein
MPSIFHRSATTKTKRPAKGVNPIFAATGARATSSDGIGEFGTVNQRYVSSNTVADQKTS